MQAASRASLIFYRAAVYWHAVAPLSFSKRNKRLFEHSEEDAGREEPDAPSVVTLQGELA